MRRSVTGRATVNQFNPSLNMNLGFFGRNDSKYFKNQQLLDSHYMKHGEEFKKSFGNSSYSINNCMNDANYVIKNGTFVPELNGYVRFIGGKKYGFVGLDRNTSDITTFHIKTVFELIKKAPSLGLGK